MTTPGGFGFGTTPKAQAGAFTNTFGTSQTAAFGTTQNTQATTNAQTTTNAFGGAFGGAPKAQTQTAAFGTTQNTQATTNAQTTTTNAFGGAFGGAPKAQTQTTGFGTTPNTQATTNAFGGAGAAFGGAPKAQTQTTGFGTAPKAQTTTNAFGGAGAAFGGTSTFGGAAAFGKPAATANQPAAPPAPEIPKGENGIPLALATKPLGQIADMFKEDVGQLHAKFLHQATIIQKNDEIIQKNQKILSDLIQDIEILAYSQKELDDSVSEIQKQQQNIQKTLTSLSEKIEKEAQPLAKDNDFNERREIYKLAESLTSQIMEMEDEVSVLCNSVKGKEGTNSLLNDRGTSQETNTLDNWTASAEGMKMDDLVEVLGGLFENLQWIDNQIAELNSSMNETSTAMKTRQELAMKAAQ
ncbi:hypothetical protein BLNAU_4706 [Blattamonas nauphoetae]|uniref:Nucleoporin NSP1-like C-terminal domain-containing protein n=1 Tax=Blattamonas nauphoetae TaxID=2049346 RepID=A0ABQ9Y9W2_9EUKA|nr:hypothetical protein BLNAU_4706 [Blattamonas nauphoetae]